MAPLVASMAEIAGRIGHVGDPSRLDDATQRRGGLAAALDGLIDSSEVRYSRVCRARRSKL